jgi:peptide/nickel transport system substrate-binding protein
MFETLIRVKPGTVDQYESMLAESWESNADQSTWTFHLHDGIRFQDGTVCDAVAVRQSFERLLRLERGPATVVGRFVTSINQISALDERTVVFALEKSAPLFEAAISSATVSAIANAKLAKQHEVDGDWGNSWAQLSAEGMGTGPYRITRFDIEDGILFERFEDYWRGWDGPHFDQVILRIVSEVATRRELVEQGDVDIVDSLPAEVLDALAANQDLVVDLRFDLAVRYLMFNTSGPLETAAARQALCFAFPYNEVIEGAYNGHAKRAIGPCAELLRGFSSETFVYQTDLDRAKSLLSEAGVPAGTTLSIVIPVGLPLATTIAQLLGANLEEIGLRLDIQQVDFATLISIYFGDMPEEERPNLMPSFWEPDYNDGWNHLWPQVSSQTWHIGNSGHYANDEVDALLDAARDASDQTTYNEALKQVQDIVTRTDPAAIYYAQEQWPTILQKTVGGFTPNLVSAELYDFYALFRQPD